MALTIRLEPSEEKLLNKLCDITGKPSSKSLLIAADYFVNEKEVQIKKNSMLIEQCNKFNEQISELKEMFREKTDIENRINQFFNPSKSKKGRE